MSELNKDPRLFPKWYSSRYYGLIGLRKAIETVIKDKNFRDKIILDYGCGTMPYKSLFEKEVAKYIGADIDYVNSANVIIDRTTGVIDFPDASTDFVISTQVLEHVESPPNYLKEAYRVCKPGGYLILSTHGFWFYHPNPNDYWRWTASGLKKILKDNGWEIERSIGIFGFAAAALALFQDAISANLPKFLKVPFCVLMQQIIYFADSFYSELSRKENAALYLVVAKRIDNCTF
jgi:SAM-dependent methyltransferase